MEKEEAGGTSLLLGPCWSTRPFTVSPRLPLALAPLGSFLTQSCSQVPLSLSLSPSCGDSGRNDMAVARRVGGGSDDAGAAAPRYRCFLRRRQVVPGPGCCYPTRILLPEFFFATVGCCSPGLLRMPSVVELDGAGSGKEEIAGVISNSVEFPPLRSTATQSSFDRFTIVSCSRLRDLSTMILDTCLRKAINSKFWKKRGLSFSFVLGSKGQRPPLHAPLRRAQDQQDGQDIDSCEHDRLHEGAAGEDQTAAGGDRPAAGDNGCAQCLLGTQPQRHARQEHPQVRGGEEGGQRHPGGDLLCGEAWAAAVDGEHVGDAGARHPAVLLRLRRLLLCVPPCHRSTLAVSSSPPVESRAPPPSSPAASTAPPAPTSWTRSSSPRPATRRWPAPGAPPAPSTAATARS